MNHALKRYCLKSIRTKSAAKPLKAYLFPIFAAFGLVTGAAPALANEAVCKATFRSGGSVDKGMVFDAADFLDAADPHQVLDKLAEIFKSKDFSVSPLREDGSKLLLDIGPRPNYKDDGSALFVADSLFKQVYMTVKTKPGLTPNAQAQRDNMCETLAYVLSTSQGTFVPKVDPRTAPPSDVARTNTLRPTVAFDAAAAKAALDEGSATIRGTACVAHRVAGGGGGLYLASNQNILLYPDSAYLQQWVKLMRKAKPGRETVETDSQFASARLVGKTNNKGEFQFSRLKPGKYYLFTTMSTIANGSRDIVLGSAQTDAQAITEYHTTENFSVQSNDVLDKFVTVTEGQEVNITLSPHMDWKVLIGQTNGSPGIFGCRSL